MAKKIILALIILVFIVGAIALILITPGGTVEVFIDGENVSVETTAPAHIDTVSLNDEVGECTLNAMDDPESNVTTLKEDIKEICYKYGLKNPEIKINSTIGENQIPVIIYVDGTSMLPTLQDGQIVLLNKTKNIHEGDIVVAESDEYGGIIKRVDKIENDQIHLVSDNKHVDYEYINGTLYEVKGISTWVDISDIDGVVISY